MSPAVETAAWVGGIWIAIAIVAAWIKHRRQQRRTARVQQQRAQRLADINRRIAAVDADGRHLAPWAAEFEQQRKEGES